MSGQLWGTSALGGYLAVPELSNKLRKTATLNYRFRQFAAKEPAYGAGKGSTFYFDRVTGVVTAGGALTETTAIPSTNITVSQGSCTITEYGNSILRTLKLDTLGKLEVPSAVEEALRDDMTAVLDKAAADTFKGCKVLYIPTGTAGTAPAGTWDEDGTVSTTATRSIEAFDIYELVENARGKYNIPPYTADGYYMCVCSPGFARAVMTAADNDWQAAMEYGKPENLFKGEIGQFHGVRFVLANGNLASVMGGTSYKGEAVLFGKDPVMECVAMPEHIRYKKDDADFGRNPGIAWLYMGGFARTFDTATPGEVRIIHVTSI